MHFFTVNGKCNLRIKEWPKAFQGNVKLVRRDKYVYFILIKGKSRDYNNSNTFFKHQFTQFHVINYYNKEMDYFQYSDSRRLPKSTFIRRQSIHSKIKERYI